MSNNFSSFQLSKQNEKRKKNLICLRGLCLPLSLLLLRFPIYLTKGFPSIFGFSMEITITKTKTSHFLLLFSFSFALCYFYYNISVQIMLGALTLTFVRKKQLLFTSSTSPKSLSYKQSFSAKCNLSSNKSFNC